MVYKSACTDMVLWKGGVWLEVYLYAPLIQTHCWLVVDVQCHTLATSPSGKTHSTRYIRWWVVPLANLSWHGEEQISCPNRGSNLQSSSPWQI